MNSKRARIIRKALAATVKEPTGGGYIRLLTGAMVNPWKQEYRKRKREWTRRAR